MTSKPSLRNLRHLSCLTLAILLMISLGCERPAPQEQPAQAEAVGTDSRQDARVCPPSFGDMPLGDAEQYRGFDVGGQERSFFLRLPPGEAPDDGYPVFFAFHGTSETGQSFAHRANLSDFADAGMIVVAPDGVGHGTIWPVWDAMRLPDDDSPNRDLQYFDALLDCLSSRLDIDADRIFVGGHSAGGIMTNALLQQRSEVLAGGIAGSGVFELTRGPTDDEPRSPMVVIVTWGGDNDTYGGQTRGGTQVADFHFAEQAVLASRFYEEIDEIRQYHCRGEERGHAWLRALNEWKIQVLLAGPHGEDILPARIDGIATCSTEAADLLPPLVEAPTCQASESPVCRRVCQNFATCFFENRTLGPPTSAITAGLGITAESCRTCLQGCDEMLSADGEDARFVQCMDIPLDEESCRQGITGALPLIEQFNTCCDEHPSSQFCTRICPRIDATQAMAPFFGHCNQVER